MADDNDVWTLIAILVGIAQRINLLIKTNS